MGNSLEALHEFSHFIQNELRLQITQLIEFKIHYGYRESNLIEMLGVTFLMPGKAKVFVAEPIFHNLNIVVNYMSY